MPSIPLASLTDSFFVLFSSEPASLSHFSPFVGIVCLLYKFVTMKKSNEMLNKNYNGNDCRWSSTSKLWLAEGLKWLLEEAIF